MRFIHISDLHIGKKLRDRSLEEDQQHILSEILRIVDEMNPDGVIIAGDVYDTSSPTVDSVRMLDWFLTELSGRDLDTFVIAGNHDSPEKLGFGNRIFEKNRLFISGVFSGTMDRHTLVRVDERVDVYLLPFIKPAHVRRMYPDEEIDDYTDAVASAIAHTEIEEGVPKIAVTHQFIVSDGDSPVTCDSESVFVGGTESVKASVFDGFDYVALGHIHKPQSIGRETVRYCGTPLKYSLSEKDHQKSVTIVDITADGVELSYEPLMPLRDMRQITGRLEDLIAYGRNDPGREDYIYVTLTEDAIDALSRLREVFPNTMNIDVVGTEGIKGVTEEVAVERMDMMELFSQFYELRTGALLTDSQRKLVADLMDDDMGAIM